MSNRASVDRGRAGFSLTELSAVTASVAVLIAIAVPAGSRLAGHARAMTCLSRVGQMTAAFLTYAQDYDGVFPFVATMQDDPNLSPDPNRPIPDPNETWLGDWQASGDPMDAIWRVGYCEQPDWSAVPNVPCSGMLFTYARSELLYRCPEFERVSDPNKTQNVFNYTRAVWARRWKHRYECLLDGEPWSAVPELGRITGPILRVDGIHQPGQLPMVLDEQWNRHVALAGALGTNGSAYNCNDYGFSRHNIIGVYHGPPVASELHNWDVDMQYEWYDAFLWRRGGVGYYDGHAGLMRDPWPTFALGNNRRSEPIEWRLRGRERRAFEEMFAIGAFMDAVIYAQRGYYLEDQYSSGD